MIFYSQLPYKRFYWFFWWCLGQPRWGPVAVALLSITLLEPEAWKGQLNHLHWAFLDIMCHAACAWFGCSTCQGWGINYNWHMLKVLDISATLSFTKLLTKFQCHILSAFGFGNVDTNTNAMPLSHVLFLPPSSTQCRCCNLQPLPNTPNFVSTPPPSSNTIAMLLFQCHLHSCWLLCADIIPQNARCTKEWPVTADLVSRVLKMIVSIEILPLWWKY